MPKGIKKLRKSVINATANILSAPARRKARKVKKIADKQVASIKFNRQGVPKDTKTKLGRRAITAASDVALARKGQHFQSGFMAGIKDTPKGPFKVKRKGPFFTLKGKKKKK